MRDGSSRIAELDGWRGLSVLGVVVGHLVDVRYGAHPGLEPLNLPGFLSLLGVDIFFIVSGFIITRLALAERAASGILSISRFYARRVFRIVPAFYVYLFCITLFAEWGLVDQPGYGMALAAIFVTNVVPCGWFVAHSWTLSFEEQFYLLFPLILLLAGRYLAPVLVVLLALLLGFPLVRFALHLEGGWRVASQFCLSPSMICVGTLAAAYEPLLRRLATGPHGAATSAAAAGFVIALTAVNSTVTLPLGSVAAYFHASISVVLLPICLGWMVLSVVWRGGWLGVLLRHPVLQFFGLISYSLYLWQQVFAAAVDHYPVASPLMFPPLMLVVAILSYYGVERPCIRLGRQLLAPRLVTGAAAADANEKAMAG